MYSILHSITPAPYSRYCVHNLHEFARSRNGFLLQEKRQFARFSFAGYGLLVGKPCQLYYAGEPHEPWEIGTLGEFLVPDYPAFNHENSCVEIMRNDPDFEDGIHPFYCFDDNEYYIPSAR